MIITETIQEFDKFKFFEKFCDYKPHEGQISFHQSDRRFRTLACGRRWGKSKSAAHEAVFALMKSQQLGWIVAPSYELAQVIFDEVLLIFLRTDLRTLIVNYSKSKGNQVIELSNGSRVYGKSADNPESLLGRGLDFLIVDEAARIKEEVWDQYLRPTLADKHGWAIFISTPRGMNWFYKAFIRGNDKVEVIYMSWQFPTSSNPYIDPLEIEEARRTTPEKLFKQEWLAEFLEDIGGVFRKVRQRIMGALMTPIKGHEYVVGVDLAKTQDWTVITVMDIHDAHVVHFDRFNEIDWKLQKERITYVAKHYNNASVLIDSHGVGDPIFEDLSREEIGIDSYDIKSNKSKRELIERLVIGIEQGELSYPEIPEMITELQIYEYNITPSKNITYQAPENFHDDCVISLALAFWAGQNRFGLAVVDLNEPKEHKAEDYARAEQESQRDTGLREYH